MVGKAQFGAHSGIRLCVSLILTVIVTCIATVGLFFNSDSALGAQGHECTSVFGGLGLSNGQFVGPEGAAVNESTGRVYVVDSGNNRVEFFSATGAYEGQFGGSSTPAGTFSDPQEVAVDDSTGPSAGDVYVIDRGNNVIDKFTSSGEYLGQLIGTPSKLFGGIGKEPRTMSIAVDPSGQLWVDFFPFQNPGENQVALFEGDQGNTFVKELTIPGAGELFPGLAANSQGDLYIKGIFSSESGFSKVVEDISLVGDRLNSEFGGEPTPGWVAIESSTNDVYLGQVDHISRYSHNGVLLERLGSGLLSSAAGIAVDSARHIVYVVDSSNNVVHVCPLESPQKATVQGESVNSVTAEGATLLGAINPRGASTAYRFEYGECTSIESCSSSRFETSIPAPDGLLSASFEVSTVNAHLDGLSSGTVYHFRLVAQNTFGQTLSNELVFVTQASSSSSVLLDGRELELVTPPDTHGAQVDPISETGLVQASFAGDALGYQATNPVESSDSQGLGEWAPVISSRSPDGWSSVDVGLSHRAPIGAFSGFGQEYRFFSDDLTSAVVESVGPFSEPQYEGETDSFPESTDRTPYVRHNSTCLSVPRICYEPIVTAAEDGGDVSRSIKFGGSPEEALGLANFVGSTPDISHVIVSSAVQLTQESAAPQGGLYEWTAVTKALQLVSVLPDGESGQAAPHAQFGGNDMERNAISSNGARVFFTASAPGQEHEHLYMRDTASGETIRLDVAEGGSESKQPAPFFQTASVDGSEAFFRDPFPLTADAGTKGPDLYECKIIQIEEAGKSRLKCALSNLTPIPASGEPENGELQGSIPGISENGEYVYFVANGVQAERATLGDCHGAVPSPGEKCNLYVRHNGVTSFIASLSSDDSPDWGAAGPLGTMTSRVSPDGEWLAFMSDMPLTGYDNRDVTSGLPDEEVYLYNTLTQRLVCVSCNPTNGRPAGKPYRELDRSKGGLAGGDRVWRSDQWLAANVPGWTSYRLARALYQSRYLSNSGRLFFNSSDSLIPVDTNGNEDVYEYEPIHTGPAATGCYESSFAFISTKDGCVDLVSSGLGFEESAFLDASSNGSDVFFLTAEKLVSQDVGTGFDVYDAHECSPGSPCPKTLPVGVPECVSAAACRAAAANQPQIFGAPPSATFTGVGNVLQMPPKATKHGSLIRSKKLSRALKVCKKGPRRQRNSCERQARKRYGKKKAKHQGARK